MEKIHKLINEEEYEQALRLLLETESNYLEKIQCLYELEKIEELIAFFNSIKDKIDNNYYEIFGYVINALVKKEDFDTALSMMNEELSLPYIPQNYQEIINDLYDSVVAMKQLYLNENNAYLVVSEEQIKEILENDEDYYNLYEVVMDLSKYNIRSMMDSINIFLKRDVSNILKTLVLEECLRQEVNQTLLVIKDGVEYEFLASANEVVEADENYLKCVDYLADRLDKNPSFLEMALTILLSYSYIVYPLTIEEDEVEFLSLIIEYYIYTLNFEEININYEELGFTTEKIEAGFEWLEGILKDESDYENGLDQY